MRWHENIMSITLGCAHKGKYLFHIYIRIWLFCYSAYLVVAACEHIYSWLMKFYVIVFLQYLCISEIEKKSHQCSIVQIIFAYVELRISKLHNIDITKQKTAAQFTPWMQILNAHIQVQITLNIISGNFY